MSHASYFEEYSIYGLGIRCLSVTRSPIMSIRCLPPWLWYLICISLGCISLLQERYPLPHPASVSCWGSTACRWRSSVQYMYDSAETTSPWFRWTNDNNPHPPSCLRMYSLSSIPGVSPLLHCIDDTCTASPPAIQIQQVSLRPLQRAENSHSPCIGCMHLVLGVEEGRPNLPHPAKRSF